MAIVDPNGIANLDLWVQGDDANITTSDGTLVDQMTDLSGQGNHRTQLTSANRPDQVHPEDEFVLFDGDDEHMEGGGLTEFGFFTVCMRVRLPTSSATEKTIWYGRSSTSTQACSCWKDASNNICVGAGIATPSVTASDGFTLGEWHTLTMVFDPTTEHAQLRIDGVDKGTSTAVVLTTASSCIIGSRPNGTSGADILFGGLAWYSRQLTTGEMDDIEEWMLNNIGPVPPTPAVPLSYVTHALASGTQFSYAAIEVMENDPEVTHSDQLRVFVGETEIVQDTSYTADETNARSKTI